MEAKPLTFQFSKNVKKSAVVKTSLNSNLHTDQDEEIDFVKAVDRKGIESTKKRAEKPGPLVIPLKKARKNPVPDEDSGLGKQENDNGKDVSNLDKEAAEELVKDLSGEGAGTDSVQVADIQASGSSIAQGATIGEVSSLEDYDSVPVEEFAKALFRGMGWKEGDGIGKQGVSAAPFEAVVRPKGLGLGASVQTAQAPQSAPDGQPLVMKPAAFVQVVSGKEKGSYGQVTSLDGEGQALVKMALSERTVSLPETVLLLVTHKHYRRHSKVINQEKYDAYREKSERTASDSGRHTDGALSRERAEGASRARGKDGNGVQHREHQSDSRQPDGANSKRLERAEPAVQWRPWVRPQLRVRCIDRKYQQGRYYKQKLEVVDVVTEELCVCADAGGRLLEGLSTRQLETVVPRAPESLLMVVRGGQCGQVGELLERDARHCRVTLQLLPDREVTRLDFDDVCEYVGSAEAFR